MKKKKSTFFCLSELLKGILSFRKYFMIYWLLCYLILINFEGNNSKCFISPPNYLTMCLACDYRYFYDYENNNSWPGGEVAFDASSCFSMNLTSKMDFYVSPNPCEPGSACDGTINSPFDNLVTAFRKGERCGAGELRFYLLSDMKVEEDSVHFINKIDYPSSFLYLFRRYYADISLLPLYCDSNNLPGCIRNSSLRPKIYIRSQSIYIFVTKSFYVSNLIFDGSEIIVGEKNQVTEATRRKIICRGFEDESISPECKLRNRQSAGQDNSLGFFNVEPPIDCSGCPYARESLALNSSEFRFFHTIESQNHLGSLITFQSIKYEIIAESSVFEKIFLPNGLINGIPPPQMYSIVYDEYQSAVSRTVGSSLILNSCLITKYNFFENYLPSHLGYTVLFQQADFMYDIKIVNCLFSQITKPAYFEATRELIYFINTRIPTSTSGSLANLTISKSSFTYLAVDYFLFYNDFPNDDFTRLRHKTRIDQCFFQKNNNTCFQVAFMDMNFTKNTLSNLILSSCSFLEINIGHLYASENNMKSIKVSFSEVVFDFKSLIRFFDQELFKTAAPTDKAPYEAANITSNNLSDSNIGILRCYNFLSFLIFANNLIINISNPFLNLTKAKVEKELLICNNTFENINCYKLLLNECFKNLTVVNNSFTNLTLNAFMNAVLFSFIWPFSTISIEGNWLQNIRLESSGFDIEGFSESSQIIFEIFNNTVINLEGMAFAAFFEVSYSLLNFSKNCFLNLSGTSALKSSALNFGDLQVNALGNIFQASREVPADFLFYSSGFQTVELKESLFIGYGKKSTVLSQVNLISFFGSLLISKCTFQNLSAKTGGAIFLKINSIEKLKISNCFFFGNSAGELSADIIVEFAVQSKGAQDKINNPPNSGIFYNKFVLSHGKKGGSVSILERTDLISYGNLFIGTSSSSGGVFYIFPHGSLLSSSESVIESSAAGAGGFLYSLDSLINLKYINIINVKANRGGAILLENSYLILSSVKMFGMKAGDEGGALFSLNSILKLSHLSVIHASSNKNGGSFFVKRGALFINSSIFEESSAQSKGGCLYLENLKGLKLNTISIKHSTVGSFGIIYISGLTQYNYNIRHLSCEYNVADKGECLFISEGNYSFFELLIANTKVTWCAICISGSNQNMDLTLSLTASVFKNNSVIKSMLDIDRVTLVVKSLIFMNSIVSESFIFIRMIRSQVFLQKADFITKDRGGRFIRAIDSNISARNIHLLLSGGMGAVSAQNCLHIYFEDAIIDKAKVLSDSDSYGAGFYIQNSNLCLNLSKIQSSFAFTGGAIFGKDSNLTLVNVLFLGNSAEIASSNIHLTSVSFSQKQSSMKIIDTHFLQNPGIFAEYLSEILLEKVYFFQVPVKQLAYQKNTSVILRQARTVIIIRSIFRNFYSTQFSPLQLNAENEPMNITIKYVYFLSCFCLESGGALTIAGQIFGFILGSFFQNNTSNKSGGAINSDTNFENLTIEKCIFENNRAEIYGHVLKILNFLPILQENSIASAENSSILSSYGYELLIFEGERSREEIQGFVERNLSQSTAIVIASGQSIAVTCAILDHYRNILIYENDGEVKFQDELNQSIAFENETKIVKGGLAFFSNLVVTANPGENFIVTVYFQSKESKGRYPVKRNLTLQSRDCIRGEVITGRKCEPCMKGTYSLIFEPIKYGKKVCDSCKANSDCPGKDIIIPKDGYWRKDENQTLILRCRVQEACLSHFPFCSPKYHGNLCFKCLKGFGKIDTQSCLLCSFDRGFVLRFVMLSLVSVAINVYQIWSAFNFDELDSKRRSMAKLLIDKFTYVGMISSFNIDWNGVVESLLSINNNYLTVVPTEIFNFDCFLSIYVEPEEKFIKNSIIVSFSPLIFGLLSLLCFYFLKAAYSFLANFKQKGMLSSIAQLINQPAPKVGFKQRFLVTCLVIYYNFYPKLLMNGLTWLRCIPLDDVGTLFLESEPDMECWKGIHLVYVLWFALPIVLIWSILLPLVLLLLTKKYKERSAASQNNSDLSVFNYLTIDYKEEYYSYDCFCYVFKFFIVLSALLTNSLDPNSQGACMIFVMLLVFLINEKVRPFKYEFVNNLATYSYVVTICTGAFAIMASAHDLKNYQRLIYFTFLVLMNLVFYIVWGFYFVKEGADWKSIRSLAASLTFFKSSPRKTISVNSNENSNKRTSFIQVSQHKSRNPKTDFRKNLQPKQHF